MIDPRFHFQQKYCPNNAKAVDVILRFFLSELQKSREGIYTLTWNYAKNVYNLKISYSTVKHFLHRYERYMKWLRKARPEKYSWSDYHTDNILSKF